MLTCHWPDDLSSISYLNSFGPVITDLAKNDLFIGFGTIIILFCAFATYCLRFAIDSILKAKARLLISACYANRCVFVTNTLPIALLSTFLIVV